MLECKKCPECGAEIVFQYVTPSRSYRIENGEIVRDDAWTGPGYDDSYFHFRCSDDSEHDIECNDKLAEWCNEVEFQFKEKGHYYDT
jgi:hypothetical protein